MARMGHRRCGNGGEVNLAWWRKVQCSECWSGKVIFPLRQSGHGDLSDSTTLRWVCLVLRSTVAGNRSVWLSRPNFNGLFPRGTGQIISGSWDNAINLWNLVPSTDWKWLVSGTTDGSSSAISWMVGLRFFYMDAWVGVKVNSMPHSVDAPVTSHAFLVSVWFGTPTTTPLKQNDFKGTSSETQFETL